MIIRINMICMKPGFSTRNDSCPKNAALSMLNATVPIVVTLYALPTMVYQACHDNVCRIDIFLVSLFVAVN